MGGRKNFRYTAIKAAEDLNYGEYVIEQIKAAKSDEEISRIMCRIRNNTISSAKSMRRTQTSSKRADYLSWALL